MTHKQYMVVILPRDTVFIQLPSVYNDYDEAFGHLNNLVAEERQQITERPRREIPIRVALRDEFVELWIIERTTELT